ncbi:helix-turn-helix domain-containing protein [Streptomyces vinaceus]|uniref:helix-turn-helix domain-containing protein n=1 Tax=Streptomyces vinaceus TaxID=1960 RepID=UPI003687CBCC
MLEQPAFGRRLRAFRRERGLSQTQLATGGLSTGYLSRLESGTRPVPTRRVVEHLCRRLGVPPSAFDTRPGQSLAQALALAASSPHRARAAGDLAALIDSGADLLDPALRWQALWLLAGLRHEESRYGDEHELLVELTALSETIGIPELIVRALTRLSRCSRMLGDTTRACAEAAAAHRLAGGLSAADRSAVLHALIRAETDAGRLAEARAHVGELGEITAEPEPPRPSPAVRRS